MENSTDRSIDVSTITTAFLGVAHIHTPGFIKRLNDRQSEIRVKSVYDVDPARARKRAGEMPGAEYVSTPEAIFDDVEIDAVVICSETVQHKVLVEGAAAAGKHMFCEKPIGIASADALAMADAVKQAGVTFQTGFFMRGDPAHQFVKREVAAGNLGKITRIRYSNCHDAALGGWFDPEWMWLADKKLAGGGAMLDLGAHPLDLIVDTYLQTEGEVVDVAAKLGNRGGRYGSEIDEYGTALLTFASGATAVIEASWVDRRLRSPIEVFGTEGQIQIVDGGVRYFSNLVDGADGKSPVADLPPAAPHAFDLFWDKLLGKPLGVPLIGVDQAALGSTVMERIYQAAGR